MITLAKGVPDYESFMKKHIRAKLVYCNICGKPIVVDGAGATAIDEYRWSIDNKVHVSCVRQHQYKMQKQQLMKQQQEQVKEEQKSADKKDEA
jgi:hypothetical protein